jgi:hypothetical protein
MTNVTYVLLKLRAECAHVIPISCIQIQLIFQLRLIVSVVYRVKLKTALSSGEAFLGVSTDVLIDSLRVVINFVFIGFPVK